MRFVTQGELGRRWKRKGATGKHFRMGLCMCERQKQRVCVCVCVSSVLSSLALTLAKVLAQ